MERMVATSHPLAVNAAVQMLDEGGTAADAAVAAAAMLGVVDPRSTGIGGDAFALYWPTGDPGPAGLAAAGTAPSGMDLEALIGQGFDAMPVEGPWTVSIPGSVAGWTKLLSRFGHFHLDRVLAPAIGVARHGFKVTPVIAEEWQTATNKLRRYEDSASVYLPFDRAPRQGEVFRNPDLARSMEIIASEGSDAFYKGELAEAIGAAVATAGGPLTAQDLSSWRGAEWIESIQGHYRGVDVYEMPPPGQGLIVLVALGIYDRIQVEGRGNAAHAAIEAIKMAFSDGADYVADPRMNQVPIETLLSPGYLSHRARQIDMEKASTSDAGRPVDTVYVAVVDNDGNACSFIQSLYEGFGSGLTVPGTGILLQNRASNFVLDSAHPNCVAPGKRPYHTIIPAMLGQDGEFYGCLGVVGDFMQPQGQFQIIRHLVDEGASPSEAVAAPRWRYIGATALAIEPGFDTEIVAALELKGHDVRELMQGQAGGAQVIVRNAAGLLGASDPRKDGTLGA